MSGRVGGYTLIHRLGQGGVANIFLARRDGSNEACVLKLLRAEVEGDRHSMARFQREAQLASLLHHPNIARITDAQFEDGTFYIAMERIHGHNIGELMRRLLTNGMLPSIGTVVFIGARALEGLGTHTSSPIRTDERSASCIAIFHCATSWSATRAR